LGCQVFDLAHDRIEAELALKAGAVGRAFIEIIAQSSVVA